MVIIFTGNGKGKTSAGMGTVLRALYHKKKVVIVQFLKPGTSSEVKLLKNFDRLNIHTFGKKSLINPKSISKRDKDLARKALKCVEASIRQKTFLMVLDEILVALKFKLLSEKQILDIITQCKEQKIHLILTGRCATKKIINASDLVTEMRSIKHPFKRGIKAIKGIDF